LVGLVLLGGMLLYAAMHKQPIPGHEHSLVATPRGYATGAAQT
jgi:hypothetical protein